MSRRLLTWLALFGVACATAPAGSPSHAGPVGATSSSARASPSGASEPSASSRRPAHWAEPLERPGLPNLHRVSPVYYRSAQPTADGMREAVRLGVRTVVNLRAVHSDRDEIGELPLRYEHISAKAWHAEDEDVVRFLRIVTRPENQPVLVHCQHGADRTGMMTAVYRVVVEGWSKDEAIAEMTRGGFGHHSIWTNLVAYVRKLDVQRIAREAGIEPAPAPPSGTVSASEEGTRP